MNVTVDTSSLDGLSEELRNIDTDTLLNSLAVNTLDKMSYRVHVQGLASDGSPIGDYTPGYMKVRTGSYPTPDFTRGKKKGTPRPKYNRSAERKVVLSLTREMENDMKVFQIPEGYGIGFSNPHNYDKAVWQENTYQKAIWELTGEEEASNNGIIDDFMERKGL